MNAPTNIRRRPSTRSRRSTGFLFALLLAAVFGTILLVVTPAERPAAQTQQSSTGYTFLTKWGSLGSGDGQFNYPMGVDTDSSGNVYVADYSNNRIQKFTANGAFITKWGSYGDANGQFYSPSDVATDSSGNVYVVDTDNSRVQKFTANGAFITRWGSYGDGNGQFYLPYGIATDASGNVYVADFGNDRIQKFAANGAFLTQWGTHGSGNGQFDGPIGIATDASGNVYVADLYNNRIQKFAANGAFLTQWGTYGSGNGQFNRPMGIDTDASGNVFVTDQLNCRVQKFTANGTFVTKWGIFGSGDGQFSSPYGIATDASGNVYVSDGRPNHRVQKFGYSGNPLTTFEENNRSYIDYQDWEFYTDANFSGGYSSYSDTTGAKATFSFTGTSVYWVTQKLPDGGITNVYLDGVLQKSFDAYSATPLYNRTGFYKGGLANRSHTLKLVVSGRKNAASSGYFTEIDRFLVNGATSYQENSASVAYGPWGGATNTNASGGAYRYSGSTTSGLYFGYNKPFVGPTVQLITAKGPARGQITIKVYDKATNALVKTVSPNLYAASVQWKVPVSVTGLDPAKRYYLRVTSAAAGKNVVVDAFRAVPYQA